MAAQLTTAVKASAKAGVRMKVAVIGSEQDLGSVPSLFGKPSLYARFLGTELESFYTQRLLVVMPSGFGVFFDGKPTTREIAALANVTVASPAPDDLTKAKPKRTTTVTWKVPSDLSTTSLRFCVLAQDAAGNQSKTSCAALQIS